MTAVELIIVIALLAIIAAALVSIAIKVWLYWGPGPSAGGGKTAPPDPKPLTDLKALINKLVEENRSPTDDECIEMRKLVQDARDEGVDTLVVNSLNLQVEKLCP